MDARAGQHYEPTERASGHGPIYHNDIADKRADTDYTPQAFARVAVKIPEFGACISRRVSEYVFADRAFEGDIPAVAGAFASEGNVTAAFHAALMRYARRLRGSQGGSAIVSLPEGLQTGVETRCLSCHQKWATIHVTNQWPIGLIRRMAIRVGNGSLPKDTEIPTDERQRLVHQFDEAIDGESRGLAAAQQTRPDQVTTEGRRAIPDVLPGRPARALPVYDQALMLERIQHAAGATQPLGFPMLDVEPSVAQFTPGLAAVSVLQAPSSCKKAGRSGAELEPCIQHAASPGSIVNASSR